MDLKKKGHESYLDRSRLQYIVLIAVETLFPPLPSPLIIILIKELLYPDSNFAEY